MTTVYHGITLIVNKQYAEPLEIRGRQLEASGLVPAERVHLDDAVHEALADKFARDWSDMVGYRLPGVTRETYDHLVYREESNNPNRDEWDRAYLSS